MIETYSYFVLGFLFLCLFCCFWSLGRNNRVYNARTRLLNEIEGKNWMKQLQAYDSINYHQMHWSFVPVKKLEAKVRRRMEQAKRGKK